MHDNGFGMTVFDAVGQASLMTIRNSFAVLRSILQTSFLPIVMEEGNQQSEILWLAEKKSMFHGDHERFAECDPSQCEPLHSNLLTAHLISALD